MPEAHALLSASSSKQWIHCPPSVRLQESFPNESSIYAVEGTFAHEVCEYKVRKYLHERVKRPQSEEFYTEEIDAITDVYAEFVITIIEEMKRNGCEPLVLVEERVDYSHIAPSGFGTADMLIVGRDDQGKGLLHVCDFKTGQGVFVDADHNSQMMLYALGGLAAYGYIYEIETVRMRISQPLNAAVRSWRTGAKASSPSQRWPTKEKESRSPATGAGSAVPSLYAAPARMKHWRFAEKNFWISTQARLQTIYRRPI